MTQRAARFYSLGEKSRLGANRQRIAQPKSPVSRQRIAYLNDRENRHFRRGKCRLHMPISLGARHSKIAVLRKSLVAPPMNGLENQDFLGVAMVGSGDRGLVDQSRERLPVCHQRQSEPTPNEAIHCRSKATKAERSAVGSQPNTHVPHLRRKVWRRFLCIPSNLRIRC